MEGQGADQCHREELDIEKIELVVHAPEGRVHQLEARKDEAEGVELHLPPFHEEVSEQDEDRRPEEHEGHLTPDRDHVGGIVTEDGEGHADDEHPEDLEVSGTEALFEGMDLPVESGERFRAIAPGSGMRNSSEGSAFPQGLPSPPATIRFFRCTLTFIACALPWAHPSPSPSSSSNSSSSPPPPWPGIPGTCLLLWAHPSSSSSLPPPWPGIPGACLPPCPFTCTTSLHPSGRTASLSPLIRISCPRPRHRSRDQLVLLQFTEIQEAHEIPCGAGLR